MRVIATITTRIGGTGTIIEFNDPAEKLGDIERAIDRAKMELERTFFAVPKTTVNWQTIIITLERGKE